MTNLSPQAQAIVNAALDYTNAYGKETPLMCHRIGAALSAASDLLTDPTSAHTLYALSEELKNV